jgi:hypothetical protein
MTTDPAKERHMSDPATTVDPATTSRQPFDEVPEAARGPAIDPARGYLVEELRGGAWWLTDGDYQALLVTSKEGTVLVDAPPSLAPHLPAAVAQGGDDHVAVEPVERWLAYLTVIERSPNTVKGHATT